MYGNFIIGESYAIHETLRIRGLKSKSLACIKQNMRERERERERERDSQRITAIHEKTSFNVK